MEEMNKYSKAEVYYILQLQYNLIIVNIINNKVKKV